MASQTLIAQLMSVYNQTKPGFVAGVDTKTFPPSVLFTAVRYTNYVASFAHHLFVKVERHKVIVVSERRFLPPAYSLRVDFEADKKHLIAPIDMDWDLFFHIHKKHLIIPEKHTRSLIQYSKADTRGAMFVGYLAHGVIVLHIDFQTPTMLRAIGRLG